MDIRIVERPIGSVTVLDIVGKLAMDRSAQRLKDKINSLISQGRTHIVLNLKDVPYIDSSGLGELVASYGSVMKTGGALKLLNVSSRNHDLLVITRLVTVFESFDFEDEAVQSFQTPASSRGREGILSESKARSLSSASQETTDASFEERVFRSVAF